MSEHAVLAPSSAPQWGVCSGSVAAQMSAPNIETQESKEGTAAHWVGSECLTAWRSPALGDLLCSDWLGKIAPNGVVIDDKMVEGAQIYVDDVLKVAQQFHATQQLLVEHRVYMPQIHELNWGTLDGCLALLVNGVVYLWDYKHGHREVDAEGNLQMIDYLAGIMHEFKINGADDQRIEFVIRVVQPYAYHANGAVSEWRGKLSDLRPYVNQLTHMANEAMTNPRFTAGKHCRDCSAVGTCATARRYQYAFADYVNEPYIIDNMTGHDLAVERGILRDSLAVGKSRLQAIEDELAHRIKNGDASTGLTVESKQSNRWYWTIGTKQAIALCAQFGADVSKPDVLTPKQAIAKVDAAMRGPFEQTLKTVIKQPATSLQLIPAEESLTSRAFKPRSK